MSGSNACSNSSPANCPTSWRKPDQKSRRFARFASVGIIPARHVDALALAAIEAARGEHAPVLEHMREICRGARPNA